MIKGEEEITEMTDYTKLKLFQLELPEISSFLSLKKIKLQIIRE